jgi:hypothetical protein
MAVRGHDIHHARMSVLSQRLDPDCVSGIDGLLGADVRALLSLPSLDPILTIIVASSHGEFGRVGYTSYINHGYMLNGLLVSQKNRPLTAVIVRSLCFLPMMFEN